MTLDEACNLLGLTLETIDYERIQQACKINKIDKVRLSAAINEIVVYMYGLLNLRPHEDNIATNLSKNYRDAVRKAMHDKIINDNLLVKLNQAKKFIEKVENKKNIQFQFQDAFGKADIDTLLDFASRGWVNEKGPLGQTIAHIVAKNGSKDNIKTLKERLADFNILDSSGLPPICYATKRENVYALIVAGSKLGMAITNSSGVTMPVYSYLIENKIATIEELIRGELDNKETANFEVIAPLLNEGRKQGIDLFNTQGYAHKWTLGHVIVKKLNGSQKLNNNSDNNNLNFIWLIECDPTITCQIETTKQIAPKDGLEKTKTIVELEEVTFLELMLPEVKSKYKSYLERDDRPKDLIRRIYDKLLSNNAPYLNNFSYNSIEFNNHLRRIELLLVLGEKYSSSKQGKESLNGIVDLFIDAIDNNDKPDIDILYESFTGYEKLRTYMVDDFWKDFFNKLKVNNNKYKVMKGLFSLLMCIPINEDNPWDKNYLKPMVYEEIKKTTIAFNININEVTTRQNWGIAHVSARVSNIEDIKYAFPKYDFNLKTKNRQVPLCFSSNIETTLCLVRADADLNDIIYVNNSSTQIKVVDFLLNKQNDEGKRELANRLLPILLDDISFLSKPDVIDSLSSFWIDKAKIKGERHGWTLLERYTAACEMDEGVGEKNKITIISLLKEGARFEAASDTRLRIYDPRVIGERKNKILSYLIDEHKDISKINDIFPYKNSFTNIRSKQAGLTLMHLAVKADEREWITRLLSDNADCEVKTEGEGMTPVFLAPNADCVLYLKNSVNLLAKNNNNENAIRYLYKNKKISVGSLIDLCDNKSDLEKYLSEIIAIASDNNLLLEERGTKNKKSLIELTACYGTLEDIKNLINKGANYKKENSAQETLLHHVARSTCQDMNLTFTKIDYLVNVSQIDLSVKNTDNLTALEVAFRCDNAKPVSAFLNFYLINEIKIDNKFIIFEVATNCLWSKVETISVIKLLAQLGANINQTNKSGCIPMQIATQFGSLETINAFIESGANQRQLNRKETLLHYVALNKNRKREQNKEIIKFLTEKVNININAVDDEGFTAFHKAIQYGCFDVVDFFAKLSTNHIDPPHELTLYHLAAMNNDRAYEEHVGVIVTVNLYFYEIKKMRNNFTENSTDSKNRDNSVMNTAMQYSNLDGIKAHLGEIRNRVGINRTDFIKLLNNKMLDDNDIVSFFDHLANLEYKVKLVGELQKSFLESAAEKGRASLIGHLLTCASQFKWLEDFEDSLRNKKLRRPLQLAVQFGNAKTIETLIEYGADTQVESDNKENLLHLIAFNHTLSTEQAERIIKRFLAKGININAQEAQGRSPLQIAVCHSNAIMIKTLISRGGEIAVKLQPCQSNLFHLMSQNLVLSPNEAEEIILLLQEKGLRIQDKNRDKISPLDIAAQHGSPSVFNAILRKVGNLNECIIGDASVFHLIVKNKIRSIEQCREMIGLCIESGVVDINIKNKEQWTPLHMAAKHATAQVMTVLVENGAKIEKLIDKTSIYDGATLLHLAATNCTRSQQECEDIILLCLNCGIKLDEKNEAGWSALHYAARFGNDAMILALKKYRAKVEATPDGNTLIHLAVNGTMRTTEVQKSILTTLTNHDFAIDIDEKNNDGLTAIHIALLKNNYELVKLLKEAGANINDVTSDKRSYLMLAMQNPNTQMASILLSERDLTEFDCSRQDDKGQNLLHYAILKNNKAILELLKNKAGAFFDKMIEVKNAAGKTPRQVAVAVEEKKYVKSLIQKGLLSNGKGAALDNVRPDPESSQENKKRKLNESVNLL